MDTTEDLSARVLLKHILRTETPRTPVIRSDPQAPSTSEPRSSSRLRRKAVEPQTPQNILRRSLRQKVHDSVTRKSLPATKRRTPIVALKKLPSVSVLLGDEDTPRHLLRNILQTEPVKSPVVHKKGPSKDPEPQSANKTTTGTRSSIELSGLDLPDITIGNAASTVKGLSRKRPHRSLNVTAFEKKLKDKNDAEEETNISTEAHSSLSLSSTSLSLKTPFVDVRTEKKGLQRKVSNRRKVTVAEFEAALNKRQTEDPGGFVEGNRGEVTNSEGFTLGLSKLGEPDITADIVNYNTALYAQPDATTSNFSVLATQDKPTIMASQLQRDLETEWGDERSRMKKDDAFDVVLREDEAATPPQNDEVISDPQMQEDVGESQNNMADAGVMSKSGEEKDETESETGEVDDPAESEEVEAQTEEEEVSDSCSKEDEEPKDLTEKNEVSSDSQTEKEEGVAETDECASKAQSEDVESSLSEEGEDAESSKTEEIVASASSQDVIEAGTPSEFEEDVAEIQTGDESNEQTEEEEEEEEALEHLEDDLGHISRRAHRSDGALIRPVTEEREDLTNTSAAGGSDSESEAHSPHGLNASGGRGNRDGSLSQTGSPEWTKPSVHNDDDADSAENYSETDDDGSFHLLRVTQDIEVSRQKSDSSPDKAPAQEEEEWEDEEVEEFPCETPAFVKEKRNVYPDPSASPSILKTQEGEALPAAKPKQVRRRKTKTSSKRGLFPKSYLMSTFRHFAKLKVSADVYPVLSEIMDKFFTRMVEDLETYATHAKRKTIEVEDAVLLLKRQGHVNDKVPVEALIEKYLRMEQRKILIPIATSGNVVVPKKMW